MKELHLLSILAAVMVPYLPASATVEESEERKFDPVAELKKPFAVTGGAMVISRYVGFSNGAVFYKDPIAYSYLTISHVPSGFSLGVWGSTGFNREYSTDWDDEFDLTLAWSRDFGSVLLLLGQSHFDGFVVGEENANDVWKSEALLSGEAYPLTKQVSLTPYAQYELYITHADSPVEGGGVYSLGFTSEVLLSAQVALVSNTSLKYDDGGFGLEAGLLFKHLCTLQWRVNANFTVNIVEATVWSPLMQDARNTENTIGTGFQFSF